MIACYDPDDDDRRDHRDDDCHDQRGGDRRDVDLVTLAPPARTHGMPPLKNARQEIFAQVLAQGTSKTEAYAMAGYRPDRHHAARMATKGHVAQRVAEI